MERVHSNMGQPCLPPWNLGGQRRCPPNQNYSGVLIRQNGIKVPSPTPIIIMLIRTLLRSIIEYSLSLLVSDQTQLTRILCHSWFLLKITTKVWFVILGFQIMITNDWDYTLKLPLFFLAFCAYLAATTICPNVAQFAHNSKRRICSICPNFAQFAHKGIFRNFYISWL